ncbi:helix-turn-helix transcriptional regulator [Streptomyces sp. BBFR102]|uniref:helix-turn-helix transcriptional regulator n=1 Tax=Streptomyces sp. BBFR102 TaxID=3448171 RepID=UPI003F52A9B6
MGLAERRRARGYSQEKPAHLLGVDRTTVGRWESGRVFPQPPQRRGLANALGLGLDELDCLLAMPAARVQETARCQTEESPTAGDSDEMVRRAFERRLRPCVSWAGTVPTVGGCGSTGRGSRRSGERVTCSSGGSTWRKRL